MKSIAYSNKTKLLSTTIIALLLGACGGGGSPAPIDVDDSTVSTRLSVTQSDDVVYADYGQSSAITYDVSVMPEKQAQLRIGSAADSPIIPVSIEGVKAPFHLVENTCSQGVPVSGSCQFKVGFTPTKKEDYLKTAQFNIKANDNQVTEALLGVQKSVTADNAYPIYVNLDKSALWDKQFANTSPIAESINIHTDKALTAELSYANSQLGGVNFTDEAMTCSDNSDCALQLFYKAEDLAPKVDQTKTTTGDIQLQLNYQGVPLSYDLHQKMTQAYGKYSIVNPLTDIGFSNGYLSDLETKYIYTYDHVIFSGTANALLASVDGGKTWQSVAALGLSDSHYIKSISASDGMIAIGFNNDGLVTAKFDPITATVSPNYQFYSTKQIRNLPSDTINALAMTNNHIFIGTAQGLARGMIDHSTGKVSQVINLSTPENAVVDANNIKQIELINDRIFIVSAKEGLLSYAYDVNTGELSDKKSYEQTVATKRINQFAVKNGKLLIATADQGIVIGNTNKAGDIDQVTHTNVGNTSELVSDNIVSIAVNNDNVFFAQKFKGITVASLDEKDNLLERIMSHQSIGAQLPSIDITRLAAVDDKVVIATKEGLAIDTYNVATGELVPVHDYISAQLPKNIKAVTFSEDKDQVLVASKKQLTLAKYDQNTGQMSKAQNYDLFNDLNSYDNSSVAAIANKVFVGRMNTENSYILAVATYDEGGHISDIEQYSLNDVVAQFNPDSTNKYHSIYSLAAQSNHLFVATDSGIVVLAFDAQMKHIESVQTYTTSTEVKLPTNHIDQLKIVNNKIFITSHYGLAIGDVNSYTAKLSELKIFDTASTAGLPTNTIFDVAVANKVIAMGTMRGVAVADFNPERNEISNVQTYTDELPSNVVHTLDFDHDHLFIGTSNGLMHATYANDSKLLTDFVTYDKDNNNTLTNDSINILTAQFGKLLIGTDGLLYMQSYS